MRKIFTIEVEPEELERLIKTAKILSEENNIKIKKREAARIAIVRLNKEYLSEPKTD